MSLELSRAKKALAAVEAAMKAVDNFNKIANGWDAVCEMCPMFEAKTTLETAIENISERVENEKPVRRGGTYET